MSRQHTPPRVVTAGGKLLGLKEALGLWNEDQLQELLFTQPDLLPVYEVEPFFTPLVPLAREVGLSSGRLDLLYVNGGGLLTLVECKLWKNEESRRSVIGQILEYANDMSRLGYGELEEAVRKARNEPDFRLHDHVDEQVGGLDEADFVDDVNRNLRLGRFLLLIVGDGIRERTERVAAYLRAHAHLNFTFSLVELALHHLPNEIGLLVQPRVLARTLEIERAVVRIEGERVIAEPANLQDSRESTKPQRRSISVQVFFEELAQTDPQVASRLQRFIDRATDRGVELVPKSSTVRLAFDPEDLEVSFGVFRTNGTFEMYSIAEQAIVDGESIGERYARGLAELVGGVAQEKGPPGAWTVRRSNGTKRVAIRELLEHEEEWLELIERTVGELREAIGDQ